MESELPVHVALRDKLQTIIDATNAVMDAMMDGADQDQIKVILRYAGNSTLTVAPKYNAIAEKDLLVVDRDTLNRLCGDVLTECTFCELDANGIRKCQRRKDLLACGMMKDGEDCPFKEF